MAMLTFRYYLHDYNQYGEMVEYIARAVDLPEDHPAFADLGRPFYEVALDCVLDTDTGDVSIVTVVDS